MFRKLRILILLLILATVGPSAWRANSRPTDAWEHTIHVAIYPIAGDDPPRTARFVGELGNDDLRRSPMAAGTKRSLRTRWHVIAIRVAPPVRRPPPAPGGACSAPSAWSLQMRWWASQHDRIDGPKPHIHLFVLFHDPERMSLMPTRPV